MMNTDDVLTEIDEDIVEKYPLRNGGTLACGNDALYVLRDDEDAIRVSTDDIVEVQYDDIDWFLVILSLALAGFGLYSTGRDVLLGLGFAAAGVVSLYLTYRKRAKLTFKVSGRPKPLDVYPEGGRKTYEALDPFVAAAE